MSHETKYINIIKIVLKYTHQNECVSVCVCVSTEYVKQAVSPAVVSIYTCYTSDNLFVVYLQNNFDH